MRSNLLNKLLLVSMLGSATMLTACTPFWPQAGYGGFAEHRFGLSGSLAHDRFDHRRYNRVGTPYFTNRLRQDGYSKRGRVAEARYVHDFAILAFDERLAQLRARGAQRCAPGDLAVAEQLLVRVKRQWVSDLYGDALIDIERLAHRLDIVDERVFSNNCQSDRRRAPAQALSKNETLRNPIRSRELIDLK